MRLPKSAIYLLIIVFCGAGMLGQTPKTQPSDIYENFVGIWVGSDSFLKNGVQTVIPIRIEITETKKKDAIRCYYVYGKKGEKGFEHKTRLISLNSAKEEMTSHWEGDNKEHYKAAGLDRFAESGLGTFTVINSALEDSQVTTYKGLFRLDKNTFFYQWDKAYAGQPFVVNGIFSLTRENSAAP